MLYTLYRKLLITEDTRRSMALINVVNINEIRMVCTKPYNSDLFVPRELEIDFLLI